MRKTTATIIAIIAIIALAGTVVDAANVGGIENSATAYAPATRLTPPARRVSVVSVSDGDTIRVAQLDRPIRIIGYDTPERGECGYDEARNRLAQILASGSVTVTRDRRDNTDQYGRFVRHVLVNGVPVGLTMIRAGKADARYDSLDGYPRHRYQDQYRASDGPNTFNCATPQPPPTPPRAGCDPSYPTVCIAPPPPDLDCGDIPYRNFVVRQPDPHRFDGDKDGVGCET